MNNKLLIISALVATSQAYASTVFVPDLGLGAPTTTYSGGAITYSAANNSQEFYIGVLSDRTGGPQDTGVNGTSFSRNGTGISDLNIADVIDPKAVITVSGLTGSDAVTMTGVGSSGGNTTFNVAFTGAVTSFQIQIDYLNSAGTPLGFGAAGSAGGNVATPIAQVINADGTTNATVGFSTLGSASNPLNTDYVTSTGGLSAGGNSIYTNGQVVTTTNGVVTSALDGGNKNGFNIQTFDDGDTDASNDLFSSIVLTFDAESGSDFEDSRFTISLDSAIYAENGVIPEPSSTLLLGLGGLCLIARRSRK